MHAVTHVLFTPADEPAPPAPVEPGQTSAELAVAKLLAERAALEIEKAEVSAQQAELRRGQEQLRQGQNALAARMVTAPRAKPVAPRHMPSSARSVHAQHSAVCNDSPRVLSLANIPMRPSERPGDVLNVVSETSTICCVAWPAYGKSNQSFAAALARLLMQRANAYILAIISHR